MREDVAPAMLWPEEEPEAVCVGDGVHAWGWSLHGEDATAEALYGGLSAEERGRAERFVFRRDWRRYVLAHAGMRRVLGAYAGRGAGEIVLGAGGNGKPYLVGEAGLGFNLTHSDNLAVLVVGRGVELGVDVERVAAEAPEGVAGQLSGSEQAYLAGLPEEARGMAFYRCWTRKEALLKGAGVGLLGELRDFSVLPGWDRAVVEPGARAGVAGLAGWRVRELAPALGYVGCVATPGEGFAVSCFRLAETS